MRNVFVPVGIVACIGAGWIVYASLFAQARAMRKIELVPVVHAAYDPGKIDREIALHERRVKRDPEGAIGWAMLSGANLAKSREQDDDASSWRAEEAARRSLSIRRRGNVQGAMKLTQALLEQHRFQDALRAADDALSISPGDDQAKLQRADVLIEIGRFDDARKQLEAVELQDPTVWAVQARWESVTGKHEKALATWQRAIRELEGMGHVSEELIAWFQIKAGTECLHLGQPETARDLFHEALRKAPKSYKACIGLAEAAQRQKDHADAIRWSDRTLVLVNSFRAMAIRGEALRAMGKDTEAKAQFQRMHAAFLEEDTRYAKLGKGGPLGVRHPDREFATFCATHQMFQADGLRAAKRDIQNRPDALARENLTKLTTLVSD